MMQSRKIFLIIMCVVLMCACVLPVAAEETSKDQTAEDWATGVMTTIENYEKGDVNIIYTDDSVVWSGIYTDASIDLLSKQVLFVINVDLPAGYVVYDDPSTEYIDGIRLNGNTVTSYRVPIDYTQDVDYELVVRTVYAEGVLGTLAQMSDGTYNWLQLLENPVGLLMAGYYIIATVAVIVSLIAALKGRGAKVKTANEISKEVNATAEATVNSIIDEKVLPIVAAFQNTSQSLVKAFALTTSKSKDAPVALLDVLQSVSNMDAVSAIEEARAQLIAAQTKAAEELQRTKETLNNIAAHTVQEVSANETNETSEPGQEDVAIF